MQIKDSKVKTSGKDLTIDDAILHLDEMIDNPEFIWCNDDCKWEHILLRKWLQELRDIKANERKV